MIQWFNHKKSSSKIFVTSMASNILSLLTGGASSGILSILGFAKGGVINEPIFGIGKSGQRYLFGEAGQCRVMLSI